MQIDDYCTIVNGGLFLKEKLQYYTNGNILTDNVVMKRQLDMLYRSGASNLPLIISGEKGCGKDMIAQYAHQVSSRKAESFLKINCAYKTDEQIATALFGSRNNQSKSLARCSEKGTLYIENGDLMSDITQSKLIDYIISTKESATDTRYFISTSKAGKQDSTLFDSLMLHFNVLTFDIPPLRQRPEDILLLTLQQLSSIKHEYQLERILSKRVMEAILSYDWPGNIRQLINTVDRMAFFSNNTLIDSTSVFQNSLSSNSQFYTPKQVATPLQSSKSLKELTLEYEVMVINQYIEEYGSLRKAAIALKTSPSVLSSKITKFNKSGY